MSTDEHIYQQMRNAIVEHHLIPGTRLPEDKLSHAFGVSRTVTRKVLQRLSLERFVTLQANKGAFVTQPTQKESLDVLDTRIMLEPLLIPDIIAHWSDAHSQRFRAMIVQEKQANQNHQHEQAIQLTARFHFELAALANNSIMADYIKQLCYRSSLVIAAYGSHTSVSCDCDDHAQLITLFEQQRISAAQKWMVHHLETIKASIQFEDDDTADVDFCALFAPSSSKSIQ
ncbi:GntR family transcriptional regulator [Vibrio zhugei]|uniref:GntR family transcriptional regulator n=1 Tax=Vibrio zhugei TaxID=2479546 RepID=A0ABV7CCX0_9VIBR|nr:GntR family transcriptional regulator [Vibrio zhugei]